MHANKRTGYDKTVRNPRPRTLKRKNRKLHGLRRPGFDGVSSTAFDSALPGALRAGDRMLSEVFPAPFALRSMKPEGGQIRVGAGGTSGRVFLNVVGNGTLSLGVVRTVDDGLRE